MQIFHTLYLVKPLFTQSAYCILGTKWPLPTFLLSFVLILLKLANLERWWGPTFANREKAQSSWCFACPPSMLASSLCVLELPVWKKKKGLAELFSCFCFVHLFLCATERLFFISNTSLPLCGNQNSEFFSLWLWNLHYWLLECYQPFETQVEVALSLSPVLRLYGMD